jgi:hypothetical protein
MIRTCTVTARVLALLVLTSCRGTLQPYPTVPPDPRPGEADAGPRVAICYDTIVSSLDQVQATAQRECAANTQATPLRTDWYLQYCPLLLPVRATFVCTPNK